MELADFEKMEQIRARVDELIEDPEIAEALKPYYRQFCKRPCFHDEYLPAFNRDNVTLVDTKGQGVDRLTEHGIVANGEEYEIDCLVYATGFEVGTAFSRRAGCEVYGRDGLTLTEKWEDGASTLHGMHSNGFPNLFLFSLVQSGFSVNFPHMLNEQAHHVAYILDHARRHDIELIEADAEAEAAWVQTIVDVGAQQPEVLRGVHAGLLQQRGQALGAIGPQRVLRRRAGGVRPAARRLAPRRRTRRSAPDTGDRRPGVERRLIRPRQKTSLGNPRCFERYWPSSS